jgi:hypothetical protein
MLLVVSTYYYFSDAIEKLYIPKPMSYDGVKPELMVI